VETGLFCLLGTLTRRFDVSHSIVPLDFGSARINPEPPGFEEPRIIRGWRQIVNDLGHWQREDWQLAPKALIFGRI
jgi:hypothetical protein